MTGPVGQVTRLTVHGREEYLRLCGPRTGTAILLIPPLFGEMNRCRRLLSDVMATLAGLGRDSALPDLPGTAESLTPIASVTLDDWRAMIAASGALLHATTGRLPIVAAFRGGAVLDDAAEAAGHWRLTAVEGASVLRELARAQRLTAPAASGTSFAGTPLDPGLAGPLAAAVAGGPARTARLAEDPKPADIRIAGSPLWRRAEPGRDRAMATRIAEDLDQLAATCATS